MDLFNGIGIYEYWGVEPARVLIDELEADFKNEGVVQDIWKRFFLRRSLCGLPLEWYYEFIGSKEEDELYQLKWNDVKREFLREFDYEYDDESYDDDQMGSEKNEEHSIISEDKCKRNDFELNEEMSVMASEKPLDQQISVVSTDDGNTECFTDKSQFCQVVDCEMNDSSDDNECFTKESNVGERCIDEVNQENDVSGALNDDAVDGNELVEVKRVEKVKLVCWNAVAKKNELMNNEVMMQLIDMNNECHIVNKVIDERYKFIHLLIMKGTKWKPIFKGK